MVDIASKLVYGYDQAALKSRERHKALRNTSSLFTITYYFQSPKGVFSEE